MNILITNSVNYFCVSIIIATIQCRHLGFVYFSAVDSFCDNFLRVFLNKHSTGNIL